MVARKKVGRLRLPALRLGDDMLGWLTDRRRPSVEAKASRTGAIVALHAAGRPVWTARTYPALARAGYMRNPIVYRAARLVAEAASGVPWLLRDGAAEVDDYPLLALLARPNPRQAGPEFLEALYLHLLMAGNAYVEAVALEGANAAREIRELHALRPDRMSVVPDASGWPAAYEYQANGRVVRFAHQGPQSGEAVPPILHVAQFHPLNDHYGFAPLEAAQGSLDLHNAASAWNKALLDNAARPSGALVYKGESGQNLSEEQFERLREELLANFSGAGNAGRPLLLEGGLSWQTMSLSPQEMDFLGAKNGAAREIAFCFGVPPMLLGIPGDNTYSNYKEANLAFWRGTVLPLVGKMAAALGGWLGPAWGEGLKLGFDLDAIEAISAEREALWRRVNEADFLTPDEKRQAVGYGVTTAS